MEGSIPVGIVHGSRLIRDGIGELLGRQAGVHIAGTFGDIQELLERPVENGHVLLCDFFALRAIEPDLMKELRKRIPHAKILIFSASDDPETIVECAGVGASGCILQDASLEELLDAIRSVWRGTPVMSPRCIISLFNYVAKVRAGDELPASLNLTRRETEILEFITEGLSNKEIALRLYLQPQTVKNYVHLVLQKLDVHSRLEAIRLVRSAGR